jgi:predicted dehydrogenase
VSDILARTFNIFGTKANIYRDDRCFDEGTSLQMQMTGGGAKEPKVPLAVEGDSDPCGNLRRFYSAVRNGGEPYPSLLDGAKAVALVFAAERSAKTRSVVRVVQPG